ncbi:vitamin K epoxide reductase family protein [Kitasatospora kifunensis]|uniref:Putative membrane protein n=1 Tax=Kitasatospora kifunensis TaxID=58351 RepID=A0A7W7R9Z0_KITKI|nr:vitamin K epoxide reductase family protein [Kitasatospora kifunensis]MBB4928165.1 putative membrane protein [Kitasatospora kifunensis]
MTATHLTAVPSSRRLSVPVSTSRAFARLLLVTGGFGLAAATALTLEKIRLLENPAYVPTCNINPIVSCGSVMRTAQASVFGFPNSLIGIGAFAVVVTIGAVAATGAGLPRWFWSGLQSGTLFGIGFVVWLMNQSIYHIGALCPYCMVVWAAMIPLFWYITLHNVKHKVIPLPTRWRSATELVLRHHWIAPAACYAAIMLLILSRFWYFWRTLL